MECTDCKETLPEACFAIYRTVGSIVYRRKKCRSCVNPTLVGFEGRITPEEGKRLVEHHHEFGILSGKDFHEKVGLGMSRQNWYRYVRDGSVGQYFKKMVPIPVPEASS